jgi:hypothetical protein
VGESDAYVLKYTEHPRSKAAFKRGKCQIIKVLQLFCFCVTLFSALENPVRPLEPQRNNLARPQSNPQGIPTLEKRKTSI